MQAHMCVCVYVHILNKVDDDCILVQVIKTDSVFFDPMPITTSVLL